MKTKITIETINNNLVTVIRKPFDAEWVKGELSMDIPLIVERFDGVIINTLYKYDTDLEKFEESGYYGHLYHIDELKYTLTILPALPKHPKTPRDDRILCAYMVVGLDVQIELSNSGSQPMMYNMVSWLYHNKSHGGFYREITHATLNGSKVEIAIED